MSHCLGEEEMISGSSTGRLVHTDLTTLEGWSEGWSALPSGSMAGVLQVCAYASGNRNTATSAVSHALH
jgi:hypothetical protein